MSKRTIIAISAMTGLRANAVASVNEWFNDRARESFHRDHAHAHKRAVAAAVVAGGEGTAEFHAEAALRNQEPSALAAAILAKPNHAAQRELQRQKIMLKIEQADCPSGLAEILANNGA